MSGRYGPYVTDGQVNATLPKGTEPEDVDLATAVALLTDKASKGPGKSRGTGRSNAKGKGRARKKK
jgi:DNA topoisomerase-1